MAGDALETFKAQAASLAALAHIDLDKLELLRTLPEKPQVQVSLVVAGIEIYLPLAGMVDMEAEKARLQGRWKAWRARSSACRNCSAAPLPIKHRPP